MFLSVKASTDRSPWGDFWFEPVGVRSLSGVRVTADSAMRLSSVFACVRVLSESFAILPFVLYRPKVGGGKQKITEHWVYRLFCRRPNRWQTPYEWREMLQGHLVLRGNAFCHIVANGRGEITELVPIHPDRIRLQLDESGENYRYLVRDRQGKETPYARSEIWHLRGLSSDGYVGLNPIELARDAVGIGLSAQGYGAQFFANDARPSGGWIEFPGQFKDKEARRIFRESWQEMQSGGNRGKTAVLDQGMKYHELGLSNADSQFLETRKFQVDDIARMFRVPPHMIGSLERSTNNNIEHQGLEFVTYSMTPYAERWESSIEAELLGDTEGLEVEFDFTRLLRGDSKARSLYYHNGILDGWMTRNEARLSENLDPLDGLDEPLRPLNMVPESEADELEDEGEKQDDDGEPKEREEPEKTE